MRWNISDAERVDSELLVVGAVCIVVEEDLEIIVLVDDAIAFGESTPDFFLKPGGGVKIWRGHRAWRRELCARVVEY